MIKLDEENYKIETDCKTVGDFMAEAAELSGGNITIIVDGCRYEFHDNPKIRVTDETPLGSVAVERADSLLSGVTVLRVTTAPKPKTVTKSGWVNIYAKGDSRITGRTVFASENAAKVAPSTDGTTRIATMRLVWEEVSQ